jgi:NAD(P)-dependent dehydrogenase (short-subunit alcohol dehydrogenase family)
LSESRGHLLMFTSSSYTYGRALYSTYSASKAAIVNLTQALADEWEEVGIKVNCVNPERARTPMRTRAFGNEPPETLLDPDEVARKALGILVGNFSGIIFDVTRE